LIPSGTKETGPVGVTGPKQYSGDGMDPSAKYYAVPLKIADIPREYISTDPLTFSVIGIY